MKKATLFTLILMAAIWLTSCYKNYYDITDEALTSINSVSFRNDVVPIMISGACGCHNNGTTRQIWFSYKDTIYYSAIQTRSGVLNDMAKGGAHPGEGSIFFTPSQASIVRKWYDQGSKDDYVPPPITGDVTYGVHILPLYKTDSLDYTSLKNNEPVIKSMMNSGGQAGHPGGALGISPTTSSTFLTWIAQGYKP
jgi:hypothetical protein